MEGMNFLIHMPSFLAWGGSQIEDIAKAESRQIHRIFLSHILKDSGQKDWRSAETKSGEFQMKNASNRPQYINDVNI